MLIEKRKKYSIEYKKKNGEVVNKEILPVTEYPKNILALDLTEFNDLQRKVFMVRQKEYGEYLDNHMKQAFKFEEWYEQTYNQAPPKDLINYKQFIVENILSIEEDDNV